METSLGENEQWFYEATLLARSGLCLRAKCGAVIVSGAKIIGRGYNAPPKDDHALRKCKSVDYDRNKKPKYDLTCCVHAEWRAIIDALRNYPRSH